MTEQFVGQDKVVSFTYSIVDEEGELLEQSDLPISMSTAASMTCSTRSYMNSTAASSTIPWRSR